MAGEVVNLCKCKPTHPKIVRLKVEDIPSPTMQHCPWDKLPLFPALNAT